MKPSLQRPVYNVSGPQITDDASIVLDLVGEGNLMGEIDRKRWNDPPTLFQQSGRLTLVEEVQRMADEFELARVPITPSKLKTWLQFAAQWEKTKPATQQQPQPQDIPIPVPDGVVEHLFNMGSWPLNCFPPLRGVSTAPAVRKDGSVVDSAGYDAQTAVYFRPSNEIQYAVLDSPTDEYLESAKRLILDNLLVDFDFATPADRANAIALLLTGVLRWGPCSRDLIPMAVLDASMQQSGKGTLANVISQVWGGSGAMTSYPDTEYEIKQSILAVLMTDSPVVIWDNVERDIDSSQLAGLLTSRTWGGRVLGGSDWVDLPNDRLWMVTGNNIKLGKDLPRRSIWIRQEPTVDPRAGTRVFRHPRLLEWTQQRLGDIWWALLTMVRRWVALGMPDAQAPAARSASTFDDWARKVGGILEVCGIHGFLDNRLALLHDDSASDELAMLMDVLAKLYPGEAPFTARDVVNRLAEPGGDELLESLPVPVRAVVSRNGNVAISLGKWLETRRDQRCGLGEMRVSVVDAESKPKRFAVVGAGPGVYKGHGLSVVSQAFASYQI